MIAPSPSDPADRLRPILLRRLAGADSDARTRVLLLHGMADNGSVWDKVCTLAPQRAAMRHADFFTADLPWRGTGPTNWGHRAEPTSWLSETLDLLTATAGPADVVVAHSFSALLLLELLCAPTAPAASRLRGVVLVSPFFRPQPEDFDWDTMTGMSEKFVRTMEEGIRIAAGPRMRPELHRAMAQRLCETIGPYGWSRFLERYLHTPWLSTAHLRTPVLVVSGAEDRIAVTGEAAALVARLPSATLHLIEGAGHFPMAERPARFADLLDDFLRRCAGDNDPATAEHSRPTLVERT